MVGLSSGRDPYTVKAVAIPLSEVANAERKFPLEWIDGGASIKEDLRSYCLPLIGDCDSRFVCLR